MPMPEPLEKSPSFFSRIFQHIRERATGETTKPTYEELEKKVLELEEDAARRNWTAGLLWKSEENFLKAFTDNPDSICLLSQDGTILDVNAGFTRFLKYEPDEVVGQSAHDPRNWVRESTRQKFLALLEETGQCIGLEARFRAKDGEVVHGLISAWPIEILGEMCVLTITRDLSGRKRAEKILKIQRDLGIALSEARNLKEAASLILKTSFKIQGIDCGGVYVADTQSGALDLVTYSRLPRSFVSKVRHLGPETPQTRLVMQGIPIFRLYADLVGDSTTKHADIKALAVIPVKYEGQVVAAINLGSHTLNTLPENTKNAIVGIAARMGGVIARLEAEARLEESEDRFATFMDLLPGVAFMKDENERFIYVNKHMAGTFGKKDWLGRPMHELWDKDTASRFVEEDRRVLTEGILETIGILKDKNKVEHTYRTFKFPIFREDKPPIIGGISLDITKQVEAEKNLRKALQQLRAVFNTFPGGVNVLDKEFNIVDLNDYMLHHYNLSDRKSIIGRKCYDAFHGRETPCPDCSFHQALDSLELVTRVTPPDEILGNGTSFKVYTHPIRDEEGKTWGAIECIMDVTDLKLAEIRTRHALDEKELLLKEVHHRVKNNMQVISALLTLQAAQLNDPQVKKAFEDSQARIRAMAMVHEILYRAQNLARIDMAEYVEKLAQGMFNAYGARERGIELSIDAPHVTLSVDHAIPCGMVINELLTNSLKHAFPEGGPGKVKLRARALGDDLLEITISDSGKGIRADFDLARASTLGIGLVVGLVENQLGGTIEMDTTPETRFTIRFKN